MKQTITTLLTLVPLLLFGANPAYESFNRNQLSTNGFKVNIKDGAFVTNPIVSKTLVVTNPGSAAATMEIVSPFGFQSSLKINQLTTGYWMLYSDGFSGNLKIDDMLTNVFSFSKNTGVINGNGAGLTNATPMGTSPLYFLGGHKSFQTTNGMMAAWYSYDGSNYVSLCQTSLFRATTAGHVVRDCSFRWDTINRRWLAVYTSHFDGGDGTFSIAVSTNMFDWYPLADIPVLTGGELGANTHIWAPEWFQEGTNVYVVVYASPDGDTTTAVYYLRANDGTFTSYDAKVVMTNLINYDSFIVKDGTTYYDFFASAITGDGKCMAVATNLAGPWTRTDNVYHDPLVDTEGPSVVKIGSLWFCYYMDLSATPPTYTYSTSTDLTNWSNHTPLNENPGGLYHGTALTVSNEFARYSAQKAAWHAAASRKTLTYTRTPPTAITSFGQPGQMEWGVSGTNWYLYIFLGTQWRRVEMLPW